MGRSLIRKGISVLREKGAREFLRRFQSSLVVRWRTATFRPRRVQRLIAGEQLDLYIADRFGEFWYEKPHQWTELTWIRDHLIRRGEDAVDIGTNHGVTGVLFARWVGPDGHVIGFDGRPANVSAARKNAGLNRTPNFEVVHAAVGARPGKIRFLDQSNGSIAPDVSDAPSIEVPLVRLDDALKGRQVGFLKIDVEGYEIEVLRGATEILKSCPNVDLEIHCPCFTDPIAAIEEILALFPPQRYALHWQWTFDGPIVANIPHVHRAEYIASYTNVHMFARALG